MDNKLVKKIIDVVILGALMTAVMGVLQPVQVRADSLNYKKTSLIVGKELKLKVNGTKKKVKWSSEDKSVAKVSSKGKVKALKEGKVVIKAKVGKKKYKCTVYVFDEDMEETMNYVEEVAKLVNIEREKKKLNKLELDYDLSLAAIERSKELSVEFSHTRPNGEKCYSILSDYGFRMFTSRGENIANGYTTPRKVMEGWMNSEGHRGRILDPDYKQIGVGFYYDEDKETCYWSQIFFEL